ncbi:uncharacterized protein FAM241A isoform X2 [Myotis myotis]|uniref:uncharacterized protein FAM241A isoform X2 n=1 Tax=Myotis myotis TaxID=51298 RepID=UPI00174B8611|nr:uncharacterized protein FAM241A isoform X2 [Myotis myotis]
MHFLLYQRQRRISYQEVKNIQQQTWFNPTHWCKEQAFVINHFLDCEESQNNAGDPVGDDYKKMGTLFGTPSVPHKLAGARNHLQDLPRPPFPRTTSAKRAGWHRQDGSRWWAKLCIRAHLENSTFQWAASRAQLIISVAPP